MQQHPTVAEIDAMHATGEAVIDVIDKRMEAANIDDIGAVLNLLCSVTAYYIAGIPDPVAKAYKLAQFQKALQDHLQSMPDGHHAPVTMEPIQ